MSFVSYACPARLRDLSALVGYQSFPSLDALMPLDMCVLASFLADVW